MNIDLDIVLWVTAFSTFIIFPAVSIRRERMAGAIRPSKWIASGWFVWSLAALAMVVHLCLNRSMSGNSYVVVNKMTGQYVDSGYFDPEIIFIIIGIVAVLFGLFNAARYLKYGDE